MPTFGPNKDNYLLLESPALNQGAAATVQVALDTAGGVEHVALMEFSIPLIGFTVHTARMILYSQASVPSTMPWRLSRIVRPDWAETAAHWTRYRVGLNWEVAGAKGPLDMDAVSPPAITGTMPASHIGPFTFEGLRDLVQDAIDNQGLALRLRIDLTAERPGANYIFASREAPLADDVPNPRPILIVESEAGTSGDGALRGLRHRQAFAGYRLRPTVEL